MGRKAKPWYRKSHGAWYATVDGRRTHLVTGPEDKTRMQAQEKFCRLMGVADPRVEEILQRFRERPGWIDVVRGVLGIREDMPDLGQPDQWFELMKIHCHELLKVVREVVRNSNSLGVEPVVPTFPQSSDASIETPSPEG